MAEKYGEVPQKWTKKWWEYFWDYYKWHVIITFVALLVTAVTVVQCVTREKFDAHIVYAGHTKYAEETIANIETSFAEHMTDIDGNGEKKAKLHNILFMDTAGSAEFDSAMQTKLDVTFLDDCTFIYLMDKFEAEIYANRDSAEDNFMHVEDFAPDSTGEIIASQNGTGYAISLENSTFLKENNIYCEDLYLLIRNNYKTDEENIQAHKDALDIAKILVK